MNTEYIRQVLLKAVEDARIKSKMKQTEIYKHEIEQVKALGERIGYGNMMNIASTLWAMSLEEKYGITSGAFVATIPGFMKKKEAEKAVSEREAKAAFYKKLGIN